MELHTLEDLNSPAAQNCSVSYSQQRALPTCAIFAIPVQPALACWASTLVAARSVDATKAATSPVDAALIHIWGTE